MAENEAARDPGSSVTHGLTALVSALALTLLCLRSPNSQRAAESDRRFSRHALRFLQTTFGYILTGVLVLLTAGFLLVHNPYLLCFPNLEVFWWFQITCLNGLLPWLCAIRVFSVDYETLMHRKQWYFLLFFISVAYFWIAPVCLIFERPVRILLITAGMIAGMSITVLTASAVYYLGVLVIPGMVFGGIFLGSIASIATPLSRDMGILNCTIGFGLLGAFLWHACTYTIGAAVLEPEETYGSRRFNTINTAMEFYLLPVNLVRMIFRMPMLTANNRELGGPTAYTPEFLLRNKLFQSLTGGASDSAVNEFSTTS